MYHLILESCILSTKHLDYTGVLESNVTSMTVNDRRKEDYTPPPNKYNQDGKERYPWDLTVQEVAGFNIGPFVPHTDPDTSLIVRSDAAPLYAISWGWNATKRSGDLHV